MPKFYVLAHFYLYFTVNLEILPRVLFSRNFPYETSHMRSFVKIKSSRNGKITLSFADEGNSFLSREFLRGRYVF